MIFLQQLLNYSSTLLNRSLSIPRSMEMNLVDKFHLSTHLAKALRSEIETTLVNLHTQARGNLRYNPAKHFDEKEDFGMKCKKFLKLYPKAHRVHHLVCIYGNDGGSSQGVSHETALLKKESINCSTQLYLSLLL